MHALIRPFVFICLLRLRPQDLPSSSMLLAITLTAYTVSSFLVLSAQLEFGEAMIGGFVDTALLTGLTVSLLATLRLNARVIQTLTALAGSGTVLAIVAFPFISWLYKDLHPGTRPGIEGLVVWLVIVWSVLVVGHILRHAVSTSFFGGVLLSVVFYFISINVVSLIIEPTG